MKCGSSALVNVRLGLLTFAMIYCNSVAFAFDRQEIIQQIINDSLASYPGNCPCPYNKDRAGHSCGRRSAYTKPGGYAPICFATDVSDEMIKTWTSQH
jgi:hypothetical protein